MSVRPSARFLRFRGVIVLLACWLAAACGDGGGEATPTPLPSAEADALFQKGVAAVTAATTLQYGYTVYEGDDIVFTLSNQFVAPDRARRVTVDKKSGVTIDAAIVDDEVCQEETDKGRHCITLDPAAGEASFKFPETWIEENGTLAGWAIVRTEPIEGASATLIRNWHADAAGGEDAFAEELVWIDDADGRILRWDVNKFQGKGERPRLKQHWEGSEWQYNAPIEITVEESG